jgi:hypothetical protein
MAVLNNTQVGMTLKQGLGNITRGGGQMALGVMGGGQMDSLRRRAVQRFATPGMAIATGYALSQLATEGDAKEKAIRVGATLAGAVIGTLTPAGPIIGAAIGDAAGNAMISALETTRLRTADIVELDTDDLAKSWTASFNKIQAELSPAAGLFKIFEPEQARERAEEFLRIYREQGEKAARGFAEEEVPGVYNRRATIDLLMEEAARLEIVQKAQMDVGQTTELQREAVEGLVDARDEEIRRVLDLIRGSRTASRLQQEQLDALEQMAAGDLPKKAYKDFGEGVQDALSQGATAFEAFSDASGKGDEFLDEFLTRYAQMLPEVRTEFMGLVTAASQLEDALAAAAAGEQVEDLEFYRQELKRVNREMMVLFGTQTAFDKIDAFQFKGFTDFEGTEEEFRAILEAARAEQEHYADELGIEPEDMVGSVSEWVAHFGNIYEAIDDIHQQFVRAQIERWKEAQKEQEFNLQRLREFHRLTTTQEALRFAIEDLTEVEKKQLEGMWNIPEGATIMVPLQSLSLLPRGGAGELGLPDTERVPFGGGDIFNQPADKMDMAGDKMLTAAEMQLQQGGMWSRAVEEFPEGFGPEESMWNKAIQAFPEGFGPKEQPGDKLERMLDPFGTDPFQGVESDLQGVIHLVPEAVKEGFQGVQIKIPPIDATISISIPSIKLNGKAVSEAMSIRRTSRLSEAARARGMLGGGVIQ